MLRAVTAKLQELEAAGVKAEAVAIGNKGLGFLNRIGAKVVSHATQLGDTPHLDKLIGPVKVMLDAFAARQAERGVPVLHALHQHDEAGAGDRAAAAAVGRAPGSRRADEKSAYGWDYIYEPDAPAVIDELLMRYIEALVYQAVAENMASEQSARMVAMKAATDNAGNLIDELKLIYNKTRQAAITKELSEIVAGAAAV